MKTRVFSWIFFTILVFHVLISCAPQDVDLQAPFETKKNSNRLNNQQVLKLGTWSLASVLVEKQSVVAKQAYAFFLDSMHSTVWQQRVQLTKESSVSLKNEWILESEQEPQKIFKIQSSEVLFSATAPVSKSEVTEVLWKENQGQVNVQKISESKFQVLYESEGFFSLQKNNGEKYDFPFRMSLNFQFHNQAETIIYSNWQIQFVLLKGTEVTYTVRPVVEDAQFLTSIQDGDCFYTLGQFELIEEKKKSILSLEKNRLSVRDSSFQRENPSCEQRPWIHLSRFL